MNIKKTIYILITMLLGVIISLMIHGIIEIVYIKWALRSGSNVDINTFFAIRCHLPTFIKVLLPIAGAIGGYFLGQSWWRIVYIEKRHWRMKKK